jgi:sterol desaturase/sphingolipid hydroxylase (fatty acid hydroxylase superfamily)
MLSRRTLMPLNTAIGAVSGILNPLLMFTSPVDFQVYVYLATLAAVGLNFLGDHIASDAMRNNVGRMRAAGMSYFMIWGSFIFNFLTFQLPIWILARTIQEGVAPRFTLEAFVTGFVIMLSTDFLFYLGHRFMHSYWPSLHTMHHCCVESSATTNVFFHPIDLAIEFALPIVWIYVASVYILDDPWVFAVASSFVQCWYSLSHDELLQLQHTRHHRHCGTNYFIYVNWWKDQSPNDGVRTMLRSLMPSDNNKR